MSAALHQHGAAAAEPEPIALALVVDDDRSNQMVLEALLRKCGLSVVVAADGLEAVEAFHQHNPDIIFMDVMMPRMDGKEAASRIKGGVADEYVPIIFLTAMTDEHGLVECIEAGGDDVLSKPYSHVLLEAKVRAALRTRALYKGIRRDRDALESLRRQRDEDLRVAENIHATHARQETHLPISNLRYMIEPMEVLNGDVVLASATPAGGQMFMLGDFTGHGLPAAVGAMVVYDTFYAMTAKGFALAEVVREVNRKLRSTLPVGRFMAACAVEIDPACQQAVVWNGGLPDLLHWSPREGLKGDIASLHLPLGIVDEDRLDLTSEHVALETGDELIFVTDGFIEAQNSSGEMLGYARMAETVADLPGDGDPYTQLTELLHVFRGVAASTDDVSLMVVRADPDAVRAGSAEGAALLSRPPIPWRCSLELGAEALRVSDPLPGLLNTIDELQGLGGLRARLFTILAELYSNALEHGLLGIESKLKHSPQGFAEYYGERTARLAKLDHGRISFELTHAPNGDSYDLMIALEHDGSEFDPAGVMQSLEENRSASGRGIQLVRSLGTSVNYRGDGRRVEVRVQTAPAGEDSD